MKSNRHSFILLDRQLRIIILLLTRQSKLEHFGFDMLPRPSATLKRPNCNKTR